MRSHDREPNVPKIQRIELSDKDRKVRLILLCVFLAIAVVALAIGISSLFGTESGWQKIEANPDGVNCSDDFVFLYNFQGSGSNAAAANKQINLLYSEAVVKAYWLFTPDQPSEEYHNIHYLNHHVNEEVTVDSVLYEAFALLKQYGSRHVYLGPIYVEYDNLYFNQGDSSIAVQDPASDPELAPFIRQVAAFANDPQAVELQLLGENRVKLQISEAYLEFAEAHGIENFIDFNWMKNAFIIDYFADLMIEKGFTSGYLSSLDGFTRNLDREDVSYSLNIYNLEGTTIYPAAVMDYSGGTSLVYLRGYPLGAEDANRYCSTDDGRILSSHLSPADGANRRTQTDLVAYSHKAGCAEILLQLLPVYIAEKFDAQPLKALADNQIYSIWCEDTQICHTDAQLKLRSLLDTPEKSYQSFLVK